MTCKKFQKLVLLSRQIDFDELQQHPQNITHKPTVPLFFATRVSGGLEAITPPVFEDHNVQETIDTQLPEAFERALQLGCKDDHHLITDIP